MITCPPPIEGLLQPGGLLPGKSFPSFSSSIRSENKGRFLVAPSWGRKVVLQHPLSSRLFFP